MTEKRTEEEGPRSGLPLNPSVRGTGKQSGRNAKGGGKPNYRKEGRGTPSGHGRGGKASR
ncbi:MAG: hypothetical protein ACYC1C_08625 [Chloroflexota bacterium]